MKNFLMSFILLFAFNVYAQPAGPRIADSAINDRPYECAMGINGKVIDTKPLNGGAATLTYTFGPVACGRRISSYSYIAFEVEYTNVTAGNVLLTFTNGRTRATATHTPQTCSGSGTCTMVDAGIFSKAVTGSIDYSGRLGPRGFNIWKVIASHDNTPVAGDIITVRLYLTD